MEKIGVPCKSGEPYHHKTQQYNDLNYGKSDGSTSDKILIRHKGILIIMLTYQLFFMWALTNNK